MKTDYLHGFSPEEQDRLIRQADYWRHLLIATDLDYRAGQTVLDIGCGAGAVLGVLWQEFPGIRLAGIDLESRQIAFARHHLASLGVGEPDLRVGQASRLPWKDESVDHVYMMWFLEHMADCRPVLSEAWRVLRRGGTITANETDYTAFKIDPTTPDYDHLERAQFDYFDRHGNAIVGRQLGGLFKGAGFSEVRSGPAGFHFFGGSDALRKHVAYVSEFLELGMERMAAGLGLRPERLFRGLADLRAIPDRPEGSVTQIVYRAQGKKG